MARSRRKRKHAKLPAYGRRAQKIARARNASHAYREVPAGPVKIYKAVQDEDGNWVKVVDQDPQQS